MAIYDPNRQPEWTPPAPQPGYTSVPADAQPMTGGDRWALVALAVSLSVIGSCVIPGFGCLAPLIVGIIALMQAKRLSTRAVRACMAGSPPASAS